LWAYYVRFVSVDQFTLLQLDLVHRDDHRRRHGLGRPAR
jgi:hypothetical protein